MRLLAICCLCFSIVSQVLGADPVGPINDDTAAATRSLFMAIDKNIRVNQLLALEPDLQDTKIKGCTPVVYAIRNRAYKAIDTLLPQTDLRALYGETTLLHEVLIQKDKQLLDKFLDLYKQKNTNSWDILNVEDTQKNTPFHLAAYFISESIEDVPLMSDLILVLKLFKSEKGDMGKKNTRDHSVNDILQEAQKRLTAHRQNKLGWTNLHLILKGNDVMLEGENFEATKKAIADFPQDINVPNGKGTTPFLIAAYKYKKFKCEQPNEEKAKLCKELLETMKQNGADMNLENNEKISVQKLLMDIKE